MKDKVIRLPEQDPDVFELYVFWTYTGQIDMNILPEPEPTASGRYIAPSYLHLGKVWAMGNYFGDIELRDRIINIIIIRANEVTRAISVDTLQKTWSKTPPGSTIRRLYVAIMVCHASTSELEKYADQWPIEVFEEATRRYFANDPREEAAVPKWADRCSYHEHEAGDPKCS